MRNTFLDKKDKTTLMKKTILGFCITHGERSIAQISKELGASVPTATKLVMDLIEEGFMIDLGKHGTSGGRRPSIYGLNANAGYFVGVDIRHSHISLAVTDFKGGPVSFRADHPFVFENNEHSVHSISRSILEVFHDEGLEWDKVLGLGVSLTGRVNPATGESYSYPFPNGLTIGRLLNMDLGVPVFIENDSRAMTFGEYLAGGVEKERNVLFINLTWGLGMGIVLDGKLFYGKSGFSGEIGHFPLMNNDIICRCGKRGCFETGASGSALHRMVLDELKNGRTSSLSAKFKSDEKITINDIYNAIREEDMLAIEAVQKVGDNLGRGIAGLINLFNPELVIIGGKMAVTGDYLMLPVQTAIKKHAHNLVVKDTTVRITRLGNKAAPTGAALIARSKLLGIL